MIVMSLYFIRTYLYIFIFENESFILNVMFESKFKGQKKVERIFQIIVIRMIGY